MDSLSHRTTIRLGRVTKRQSEALKVRVEQLLASRNTGVLDTEAASWLGTIDDKLHRKLAKAGLVEARERAAPTLGLLLDEVFAALNVKRTTRVTYAQTRDSLEAFFGTTLPLSKLTPLEAQRWHRSLRDEGLAEATISKRTKTARQFFKLALRWKMIRENPFADIKAGVQTNRNRMRFVTREMVQRVLDAAPDAEWRVIIALSRFGGLRCPSESFALRWEDVDFAAGRMLVRSPKTEGYAGREYRHVPIFAELRPYLEDAHELAPAGTEFVVWKRRAAANLRTPMLKIIRRAGIEPWPKPFHNLRASRQTELAEEFPIHVVCAWLGNTPEIARNHYLLVTEGHWQRAVGGDGSRPAGPKPAPAQATQNPTLASLKAAQIAAQQAAA